VVPVCASFAQSRPQEPVARDGSGPITEQWIFAQLIDHNRVRSDALLEYSDARDYRVSDPNGKTHAQEEGRMEFHAPDIKKFTVTSERGSGIVRRLALNPLIASEVTAARGKERHDSAISPANYDLEFVGEQDVRGHPCYVLRAFPRRVDKYLFEGQVWIDKQDFAVVRIEGRPAAHLSFWIKRAEFVRDYEKVAGFWLPYRDETNVEVRLYGKKVLTIDHRDYAVKGKSTIESLAKHCDTGCRMLGSSVLPTVEEHSEQ
jgi:outer membrane lipoprotein-sorting protein